MNMSDDRTLPLVAAQHTADLIECMIKERLIRVDEVPLLFRDIYRAVFASLQATIPANSIAPAAQEALEDRAAVQPVPSMRPAVPIDTSYTDSKIMSCCRF